MRLTREQVINDIRIINEYAQSNPGNMVAVGVMVLLSIRQPWHGIGNQLADVAKHKDKSKYLFGFKLPGYRYLQKHKEQIFAQMMALDTAEDLIDLFIRVPGLGLAKAGFMVQLCKGLAGCIDSHNCKLYGIPPAALRWDAKLTAKTQTAKIAAYVTLCDKLGGSVFLWREWCQFIASHHPKHWNHDANKVSDAHIYYPLELSDND